MISHAQNHTWPIQKQKKPSTNTATNIFSVEINVEELPNDWYLFRSEALVLNGSGGWRRILLLHNLLEFNPITDTLKIRNDVVLAWLAFCSSVIVRVQLLKTFYDGNHVKCSLPLWPHMHNLIISVLLTTKTLRTPHLWGELADVDSSCGVVRGVENWRAILRLSLCMAASVCGMKINKKKAKLKNKS